MAFKHGLSIQMGMLKMLKFLSLLLFITPLYAQRLATPEEVKGWNISIKTNGEGLPVGSGTAKLGEPIYIEKCAFLFNSKNIYL